MIKIYLYSWAAGAVLSAIAHLVAPGFMASGTSWPLANGWQREIALFDIALALYIVCAVVQLPKNFLRTLVSALTLLSFCLGANHLLSAVNAHWSYIHVAGVIANASAVVFGFCLITLNRLAVRKTDV